MVSIVEETHDYEPEEVNLHNTLPLKQVLAFDEEEM